MVNHVVLVGNLGSDPEVRAFGAHRKVTRLSVATHDARGNKHITAEVRADRILCLGGGNMGRDTADESTRRAEGERPRGASVRS